MLIIEDMYLSLSSSVEVGLASKLISALESNTALSATALITASTVEGLARLGVPIKHANIALSGPANRAC